MVGTIVSATNQRPFQNTRADTCSGPAIRGAVALSFVLCGLAHRAAWTDAEQSKPCGIPPDKCRDAGIRISKEGARMFNPMRTNPRISASADSTTDACLLKTTSLIKVDVYDAAGELLGQIEEILIDAHSGCVRYVVLALGGFLGIGRKRFAVPWSAVTPDAGRRRCIVNVTLMRLMAVPVSQGDSSPRRAELSWSKESASMLRQQGFLGVIRDQHLG